MEKIRPNEIYEREKKRKEQINIFYREYFFFL